MLDAGVIVRQLILTLAFLALLTPAGASAQMMHRDPAQMIHRGPAPPPPPQPPPLVAPPPIVRPLPSVLPPPDNGAASPFSFEASDPTRAHRDLFRVEGRSTHGSRYMPFIGGSYFGGYATDTLTAAPPPAPVPVTTGQLRLSVTPPDAQVFIDSYFVGLASDIDARRPLTLEAGPHRLEIRAPEHETQTVDVRILPYDTVTYRGTLEPRQPAAAPIRPPATSSAPMYLIPNCYLGNVPPRASRLPSGCDIKQVQVLGRR